MKRKLVCAVAGALAVSAAMLSGCFNNPADSDDAGKPVITTALQDRAADFGDTVTFTVVVSGDPAPAFQWYKDGTALAGKTSAALTIAGVVLADAGTYVVTATNSKGSVSDTAVLTVSGGEPAIGLQSASDTVSPGDTVSLFAQVAGNRPFTWQWYRNDTAIASATDSILTLAGITAADLGTYKVIVSNSVGADTSVAIVISATAAKVFIAESDFESGQLEWISGGAVASQNLPIYRDAAVRTHGGYLYILERFGADNIIKFDPSKTDQSGVLYQVPIGDNYNPQDIEFVSATKAYIANQNHPSISIFNPSTGAVTGSIDISAYTFNPDSNVSPYANQMALAGANLYVMLQRRDGWNPGAPTLIITINTATDAVSAADTFACTFKNGYDMVYVDGALYVTNPGSWYDIADGGIEKIVLATKTVSTVMTEATLGGNPNQIVHKSGTRFYVQTYVGWKNVAVKEIDAATGAVIATLPDIVDAFGGIYYDDFENKLYVGERDPATVGVKVFENNVKTAGPLKTDASLPPTGMVVLR